jgi:hypothetical protein
LLLNDPPPPRFVSDILGNRPASGKAEDWVDGRIEKQVTAEGVTCLV